MNEEERKKETRTDCVDWQKKTSYSLLNVGDDGGKDGRVCTLLNHLKR